MFQVLIMGGSQFVSEALAKHLILKGHHVDIFTRGIRDVQYDGVRNHFKGDRNDDADLKRNLSNREYDFVFDITAYTKEQVEKVKSFIQTNKLKRYIFISSGGVYLPSETVMEEEAIRGNHPHLGEYGINKKLAEDYLFHAHEHENFPMTIFRPPYIYGEGNNLYREAYLFDRIEKGLPIPIPKNEYEVHFIHIHDVVRVLESVMFNDSSNGEAYNLTYPENITWKALLSTAAKVVNKQVKMVEVDVERMDPDIPTRHYFPYLNLMYKLDSKKLEHSGLQKPKLDLFTGMLRAYEYYKAGNKVEPNPYMNKMDEIIKTSLPLK